MTEDIFVIGLSHHTAPVELREQLSTKLSDVGQELRTLMAESSIQEALLVSTCNRVELYGFGSPEAMEHGKRYLARRASVKVDHLLYERFGYDAVKQAFRVASSLDSLVVGEPQILGQMKDAWQYARTAGTLGPRLDRLFQSTFNTAKQVRTDTAIGANPVSVAFAAVSLARQIFADLGRSTALLIGAGETIALVARHLNEQGVSRLIIANRTLERAEEVSAPLGGRAITLNQIPDVLHECDIVIASTASPLPILGKGAVERALKQRRHNPMFMVDIAVPRDIEPEVGKLADVYLYSVDDLREVIEENMRSRQDAARAAERLIELGTDEFMQRMRARAAVDVLKRYRQQAELQRDQELGKALARLERGGDPAQVMAEMARALTNKLLHEPSVQLKRMSAEGRTESLSLAMELFGLDNETSAQGKQ